MDAFGTTSRRGLIQALGLLPALDVASVSAAVQGGPLIPAGELSLPPGLIHLNTASAGPTPNRVLARTIAAWRQLERDPVAQCYSDQPDTVFTAADDVRGKAAALLGCSANEILFTRGTTDGITTLAHSVKLNARDRILLSNLEHEGGEVGWLHREKMSGVVVDRIQLPFEEHDPQRIVDAYAAALTPKTKVISVSHVLAPTGLRMPVAEIARIARSRGVLCVVDGAQAVGQISFDVRSIGCDAYATSGHKWLMGPKGTGFVYIAKNAAGAFDPPQWQLGRAVGSNSAGLAPLTIVVGLGEALDATRALGIHRIEAYNRGLANTVYTEMTKMPQLRIVSPTPGACSTAMVAAMLPPAIDADRLRAALRTRHNVVIKRAERRWFNGIRLSPHVFNDEVQVARALAALRTELAG